MKFEFARNKYKTELLIDCFEKSSTLQINQATEPFFIPFFEIIFITKGKGKFKLDNDLIPFKKGTVLLLPPNKWRQWYKIEKEFDAIYLIFEEEFISTFFNDALYLYRLQYFFNVSTPSHIQLNNSDLNRFLQNLEALKNELKAVKPDSHHLLRSLLYYVLIQINRQYQKIHATTADFYQQPLVLKFKKILEANIASNLKVREYANLLGVSPSHLNKILSKHLGKSSSEIIKERLLIEIKRRLLFSDKSISEISYDLNFSEPSNFNRFFQKSVKMTPKEFRIQNDKS